MSDMTRYVSYMYSSHFVVYLGEVDDVGGEGCSNKSMGLGGLVEEADLRGRAARGPLEHHTWSGMDSSSGK